MSKLIIEVSNADYYDVVDLTVDGSTFATLPNNKKTSFELPDGNHVVGAIYTNREADYADYRHKLVPVSVNGDASVKIEIINIFRGGKISVV